MTSENKGKYDERNQLNDLTGKEWLKMTKSFMFSEKCKEDKDAFNHPAPFLIKDIEKLITMFTKSRMTVLDPFAGSGTTLIAAYKNNRKSIGIDLNSSYKDLAASRFKKSEIEIQYSDDVNYILGDSLEELENIPQVDYIVTSPPYHNILKNKGNGIRDDRSKKGYRNGSRQGIEFYSEEEKDLGNKETYEEFLNSFSEIMNKAYEKLNEKKYCSIVISDFTVNKKEISVHSDIIKIMENIGYEFVGTIVLLQDNKPLFPFGYPYAFKINHMHQNIINFRK
ncbi:DNA methyltransferase [Staphylococcus equorum]|uniref:DNA methyltransferase n=1 Tax=Staphylococcus TaxID=1279 RepID=UPI002DBA4F1F|nr:DNA methyltransferase [Staphylococcus succinus]MEB7461493.1 N-6 DNA methylase [Staphylococcus succinus]